MRAGPAYICRALLWSAASGLFLLLTASLFQVEYLPVWVVLVLCAIAGLTVWRPALGLMVAGSVVPLATWLGRSSQAGVPWPETIVVACLGGYAARRAITRERAPASPLIVAIHMMIAVSLASLAVQLSVLRTTIGDEAFGSYLWDLLSRRYFTEGMAVHLDATMRIIEGLLLLHAATTVAQRNSSFPPIMIGCLVSGAAAAGALNIWRIWQGALRSASPVSAFIGYLRTLRFYAHYSDVNAAGSYFMMVLIPAGALLRRARGRRWIWGTLMVPIALSLALSGSRTAIVAGVAAVLALLYLGRGRHWHMWRRPRSVLAATLLAGIGVAGFASFLGSRNATRTADALWTRAEFTRAAIRMVRSAPVFGVGVGGYANRAGEFTSPDLLSVYPPSRHENAHNNFLQVMAELGLVGFGVFIWMLAAAALASVRQLAADPGNLLRWAATAGVLAFVISWLAGHPLLVDEPSFAFWLLLGTVAGWDALPRPSGHRTSVIAATLLVVALAVSLPWRLHAELARTELEHHGIGVSVWHEGDDGVSHRLAGVESTVFVPTRAGVVTVPLRATETAGELLVELRLDNRVADVVRVPADRWLRLRLPLPRRADGPRYLALSFLVRSRPDSEAPMLMIGKVTPP